MRFELKLNTIRKMGFELKLSPIRKKALELKLKPKVWLRIFTCSDLLNIKFLTLISEDAGLGIVEI